MYYLGIDAGGSNCRARLTDEAGTILGQGLSGPSNIRIGVDAAFKVLEQSYMQAIIEAKLNIQKVASIHAVIGIAGIGRKGAKDALLNQPFPFKSTKLYSDGFIANIGAHSGKDGGIVIVGTGSIAVGRVGDKDIVIGGYGFPVSDEGSGAYIGLQAIRMTLRASDGRQPHSPMSDELFKSYNNQTKAIVGWMDKASATDYAALAPLVVKAAEAGDVNARVIMQDAASHIEAMVLGLYGRGVPRCCLMGGLSKHIEPLLSSDVQKKITEPQGDALDGALWLARKKS